MRAMGKTFEAHDNRPRLCPACALENMRTRSRKTCRAYYVTHQEERRQYEHDLRADCKKHHICVQCHKRDAAPGRVRCEACLEYMRKRHADYRRAKKLQRSDA